MGLEWVARTVGLCSDFGGVHVRASDSRMVCHERYCVSCYQMEMLREIHVSSGPGVSTPNGPFVPPVSGD